jgi:hypothetical protein
MIRSDYFMRQIEQFVNALAEIIFGKKNKQETLLELDKIAKNYLGLDIAIIESMSFNQLKTVFEIDINQYHMKCFMAAELLYKKFKTERLDIDSSMINLENYLKSFELYFEAIQDNKYFQNLNVYDRMNELIKVISKYQIVPNIKFKIMRFFEISGNFAAAEDMLFDLIDEKYNRIQEEGIKFYTRLLDLSDSKLAMGNLPREEVYEGLVRFKSMTNI